MAELSLKEFVKPPFANYDIVVYFGCGLFALPLLYHYILEPNALRFPRFEFELGMPVAEDIASILSLLFSVYLLGHIIAYCSSLFIEKSIDAYFGKISSAILISTWSQREEKSKIQQAWRADRLRNAFSRGRRFQNALRALAVMPAIPLVALVNLTGGFDYYRSRVPRHLIFQAREKLMKMGYGPAGLRDPWFKVLEHCIINNHPTATARMYNYLIIYGIFRSLSLIFLGSLWLEFLYDVHAWRSGTFVVKALLSDNQSWALHLSTLAILYVAFGFSLASYMKFSRRYAEEAIFAFVLATD